MKSSVSSLQDKKHVIKQEEDFCYDFEPKSGREAEKDGRLPPAYFEPSHFCEKSFFSKKQSFFIIFSNFFKAQIFPIFCTKKFITATEKTFLSNNTI